MTGGPASGAQRATVEGQNADGRCSLALSLEMEGKLKVVISVPIPTPGSGGDVGDTARSPRGRLNCRGRDS